MMKALATAAAGMVILVLAVPCIAQTRAPEAAFGARESVSSASLSPAGTRFAFLAPTRGQGNALYTAPVDGSAPPVRAVASSGDPERILQCGWVSEQRLLCTIYAMQAGVGRPWATSRLIAVNADGSELAVVSRRDAREARYYSNYGGGVIDWLPGEDGQVMVESWFVPEARIGSLIEKRDEGLGAERVDTRTGARRIAVRAMRNANEFITDGVGNVRVVGVTRFVGDGYATGRTDYLYRPAGSDDWKPLDSYDTKTREGFNPYAVDPDRNLVYGFRARNGRRALFSRPLDGNTQETLVFDRDDVDVDGLIRLGRRGRVIGVTYATEKRAAHYFDPVFEKLRASLGRAIPAATLINFEGASADEHKLLIWAGSDMDPGRYYLFDRTTKQLRPLMLSRPELDGVALATVKPVQIRAADGAMIPGYLTLPPGSTGKGLPAIVMPHGGPGSRDEWGFDWQAQFYANRGYAVLQPNFRGSTGYGDAWYQKNGFQSWRIAIGDVVDSGRWLVAQGIADPAKLGIVGWSYGGYAALQSGVVAPDLFKAIVATAPVTDLNDLREQYRDTTAQRTARDFIGTGPHISEGSPTNHAREITAPVLLFHGELDHNVRVRASQLMADKLRDAGKPHELVLYPKLDHFLEDSAVRADMLKRSDTFLKAAFAK